jgi:hypothetical protein
LKKDFNKTANEIIVGQYFCVGFHDFIDIVEEIIQIKNDPESVTFRTRNGLVVEVISRIRPDF